MISPGLLLGMWTVEGRGTFVAASLDL